MYEIYKTYIPELNYWFDKTLLRYSILNRYKIKAPACPKIEQIPRYTFIELLFNDAWPVDKDDYLYLYQEITTKSRWPSAISKRLQISQDSRYFHAYDMTSSTLNIFDLEEDDFTLLDKLLSYRRNISTVLEDINYSSLQTNLSKMIFLYLDLKINQSYEKYNTEELISTKLIEYCYEVYLLGNFLEFMENRNAF
jgi:hypothetical protein